MIYSGSNRHSKGCGTYWTERMREEGAPCTCVAHRWCTALPPEAAARPRRWSGRGALGSWPPAPRCRRKPLLVRGADPAGDPGRPRPRGPLRVKNRHRSDSEASQIQSGVVNQSDERTVITLIRMKIFIIKTNIHLNTKLPLYPWYQKITMKKELPWVSNPINLRAIGRHWEALRYL